MKFHHDHYLILHLDTGNFHSQSDKVNLMAYKPPPRPSSPLSMANDISIRQYFEKQEITRFEMKPPNISNEIYNVSRLINDHLKCLRYLYDTMFR